MAFEKYKRKKILRFFGEALRAKLKFVRVDFESVAGKSPDALTLPALYVFRGNDPTEDLTNEERRSNMLIHVVAFDSTDVDPEIKKADMQDEIEETIYDDITMGGYAVQAMLRDSDPTAFSLDPLGFNGPVLPPLVAVRMDVEVLFDYLAQ